jgi:hypothetical protein
MYKAVLFAPDGDWVTDYRGCKTKEEVWEYIENQGSRWFFYPFIFIIKDNGKGYTTEKQRIVDVPEDWPHDVYGKSIKRVEELIAQLSIKEKESILGICPCCGR